MKEGTPDCKCAEDMLTDLFGGMGPGLPVAGSARFQVPGSAIRRDVLLSDVELGHPRSVNRPATVVADKFAAHPPSTVGSK